MQRFGDVNYEDEGRKGKCAGCGREAGEEREGSGQSYLGYVFTLKDKSRVVVLSVWLL